MSALPAALIPAPLPEGEGGTPTARKRMTMTTPSTGPHHFAMDAWISMAPFEKLLNLKIEEAADGRATLSMPFYRQYSNGAGIMHGGALVSLADTAVVMAIKSILEPGSHFATI